MFWKADLTGSRLSGAWYEDANFSDAQMKTIDLSGGRMYRAEFCSTKMHGAILNRIRLEWSTLVQPELYEAELSGVYLRKANLAGTEFRMACLKNLEFPKGIGGVMWAGAAIQSTDLSATDGAQIATAFGDASVKLPEGYIAGVGPFAHWS